MFTSHGIALDVWVMVERNCSLSCDVVGDQAQFNFGHSAGSLTLVASEDGLATLAKVATEALIRLRAIPEGADACFSVAADAPDGSNVHAYV